jgi:hypothetical protein
MNPGEALRQTQQGFAIEWALDAGAEGHFFGKRCAAPITFSPNRVRTALGRAVRSKRSKA